MKHKHSANIYGLNQSLEKQFPGVSGSKKKKKKSSKLYGKQDQLHTGQASFIAKQSEISNKVIQKRKSGGKMGVGSSVLQELQIHLLENKIIQWRTN